MKSPMDYIQEAEPIKVSGMVVASYGSECPAGGRRKAASGRGGAFSNCPWMNSFSGELQRWRPDVRHGSRGVLRSLRLQRA